MKVVFNDCGRKHVSSKDTDLLMIGLSLAAVKNNALTKENIFSAMTEYIYCFNS